MLRRKKRMQYDPPGRRKKGRKPSAPRRTDQVFLSRRMFVLKGAIVASFMTLAARLGYMQIIHGQGYSDQAKDNVVGWKELKPTRGLVYDRAGRPLAENRRTWAVSVVPTDMPEEGTDAYVLLRETLITGLRLSDTLIVDRNAIPVEARLTVYARIGRLLGDQTDEAVQKTVDYIQTQAKINYVVAFTDLTADQAARVNAVKQELPGVDVVNYLDYIYRNFRYQQTPITIKDDVSREVALTLEANRLYLPGVELDDSVLVRRYPAGPPMAHILGYVGRINPDDLNAPDNVIRVDADGKKFYGTYQPEDVIGLNGLERKMEDLLRGQKGGYWFEQNAYGVATKQLADQANPAVAGHNLQLTIDLELQTALTKALADGIDASTNGRRAKDAEAVECLGGAVVLMDPRNGEVLAMVSYPQYDNQLFVTGLSQRKFDEYNLDQRTPLLDRAYVGSFPPGSTLKLFVALAGLRDKKIDENTKFTCTGAIRVPYTWNVAQGNNYPCWIHTTESGRHGPMTVVDAIEQSCDVFFYNVGTPKQRSEGATEDLYYRDFDYNTGNVGAKHYFVGLGIAKLAKHLEKRLWFGEPTKIDLPSEATGLVPTPDYKNHKDPPEGWSAGDTINTSIGQGDFLASPLQMAVNTSAIANGGTIYRPQILKCTVDDGTRPIQNFDSEVLRQVKIDPAHLGLVHEGMRRVVNGDNGTAVHSLDSSTGELVTKWPMTNPNGEKKIIIGGKTGTAEVGIPDDKGIYSESHAWFTCFAPFDKPEVVATVFLQKGGEGATYAVPIADKALRAYFEWTGKRKRGLILREDKQPITDRTLAPDITSPAPATPTA